MDYFAIIYASLAGVVLLVGFAVIAIVSWEDKCKFLQKIYVRVFEHSTDWEHYCEVRDCIKHSPYPIKLLTNCEYANLHVSQPISEDLFYFVCYDTDIAIWYKYQGIHVSGFYKHLIKDLYELAGYTQQEVEAKCHENVEQHKKIMVEHERLLQELWAHGIDPYELEYDEENLDYVETI